MLDSQDAHLLEKAVAALRRERLIARLRYRLRRRVARGECPVQRL